MKNTRTHEERRWWRIAVVLIAVLFPGCAAGTREATFGPLANGHALVRLVVSEDLERIRRECFAVHPQALGCQISVPTAVNGVPLRRITIVRYAETLPSALTFEIDAHELCHAVASLQAMVDPCHVGNGGVALAR